MLTAEFVGASALELDLAQTIVRIRRRHRLFRNLYRFRSHWLWHGHFLAERLNSRWLISCADTLADHPISRAERATAIAAALLGNTVKLYESERHLLGTGADPNRLDRHPPSQRESPEPLFDGLTTFLVGRGDMLTNLNARLRKATTRSGPAGTILAELMRRMYAHDSVFRRMG